MSILKFQNIHRAYKPGVPVLKGVSFALTAGEVVGLLGRNGAGKTTLIRIAMGMIHPQQGAVRVFGMERELLEKFALSPRAKIKALSKGQARQVALLCAGWTVACGCASERAGRMLCSGANRSA